MFTFSFIPILHFFPCQICFQPTLPHFTFKEFIFFLLVFMISDHFSSFTKVMLSSDLIFQESDLKKSLYTRLYKLKEQFIYFTIPLATIQICMVLRIFSQFKDKDVIQNKIKSLVKSWKDSDSHSFSLQSPSRSVMGKPSASPLH